MRNVSWGAHSHLINSWEGGDIAAPIDTAGLMLRLLIDLVAIAVLAYGLSFRRYRRRDLLVIYVLFNIGLFLAVGVISAGEVGVGVAFGLFAVLSIIRLRSDPFSHTEMGYFFIAIVIALVNGIDLGSVPLALAFSAVAVAAPAIIDHERLLEGNRRIEVTVEFVSPETDALRRHLAERLSLDVIDLTVMDVDYVRETTRVAVRGIPRPPVPEEVNDHIAATSAR